MPLRDVRWSRALIGRCLLLVLVLSRCVREPEAAGTRVTLTHRGWEQLGDRSEKMRAGYDSGWDFVLSHYVQAAPTYQT